MDNYTQTLRFINDYPYTHPTITLVEITKHFADYPLTEDEVSTLLMNIKWEQVDNEALVYIRDAAGNSYLLLVVLCGHKKWDLLKKLFYWKDVTYDLICDVDAQFGNDVATAVFNKKLEELVESTLDENPGYYH